MLSYKIRMASGDGCREHPVTFTNELACIVLGGMKSVFHEQELLSYQAVADLVNKSLSAQPLKRAKAKQYLAGLSHPPSYETMEKNLRHLRPL